VFTPGVVNQVNQRVQQSATIAIYQVEGANTGQISYAIYPSGAYTAGTLQTALQALGNVQITASDGTVTGVDVAGTTVTQPGFQLA
jgi:VCBS repeat-containing protein